ncbi:MAG: UDP-N-acetylmuramoyl-L-alanyl-D-glutamate--2,6-diaminopimelate ligase [Clostridia bacterium]|nr:UDP-N-acetylmuramoyl-L-alanyl-D-glutamate--2,6-diaminopimelate ligase [Clostridia bacterium]
MKLSALLCSIGITEVEKDVEIGFITDNSKECKDETLFVCHDGAEKYITEARKNGAVAVLSSSGKDGSFKTKETRKAFSTLCRFFFGYPDKHLRLIAVTGTCGKTTTASMLSFILNLSGKKTGLISSAVNRISDEEEAKMTTPDPFLISKMLHELLSKGGEYCVIEASSQGIEQERLFGLEFETAIFTNLTEDHLDYHKTKENYKNAKKKLFSHCKTAVLNFDDPCFSEFSSAVKANGGNVLSYSAKSDEADFTAKNLSVFEDHMDYILVSNALIQRFRLNLRGEFNVENSLAATVAAFNCGISIENCSNILKNFSSVKGRMEILDTDTPFRVIIDYAHTPDSLRRSLLSLRRFCKKRLILLFGCGGEREKEKRAKMGLIAVNFADVVFLTTDNPRNENPREIIDEILSGTKGTKTPVFVRENRKEAIALALKTAKPGDILLLSGKGHEKFQQIGNEKFPFDEREIVRKLLS